jgi:hypothetical protein
MVPFSSSEQEQSALVRMWTHLSSDLQIRVIGLVAQFALKAVVTHPASQVEREETRHADPAAYPQNPSCSPQPTGRDLCAPIDAPASP